MADDEKARKRYPEGVYKRGGTWWATWTENGRTVRRSLGVKDKKKALRRAAELEEERKTPAVAAARKATVGDAVDAFLEDLRRGSRPAGTVRMYEAKTKNLVAHFTKDAKLADFTPSTVDAYFRKRQDKGAHM